MDKKYEFTGETKQFEDRTLKRIRALIDIDHFGVKKGDIGGWIETEDNLSHHGGCWISGEAMVYEDAWVGGYAMVGDNARVGGYAWVGDNAVVGGNAWFGSNARFGENAGVGVNKTDQPQEGKQEGRPINKQVGGDPYSKMAMSPDEYITTNDIPWRAANMIKYASRYRDRNGAEDIKKAIHYGLRVLRYEYQLIGLDEEHEILGIFEKE